MYFRIQFDYETDERAGVGGTLQIIALYDENNKDVTELLDQGKHYHSLQEVCGDIAAKKMVPPEIIELEEV